MKVKYIGLDKIKSNIIYVIDADFCSGMKYYRKDDLWFKYWIISGTQDDDMRGVTLDFIKGSGYCYFIELKE